ncbi:MAG: MBL fold metallo-hydrolase [Alphaproteobacteria bacterium]|nr:MBL fold metallo-hydrolase [Alphaproteobacteria bacterium]
MADLLALSSRYIDQGIYEGPASVNRINGQLSEVGEGVAIIEAFSHVVALKSEEGLVLFDTSLEAFGGQVLAALRGWSQDRVSTIAYTHGHVDHVGGAGAILAEATEKGQPRPQVIGHENVARRFARYHLTDGYNSAINARQFGGAPGKTNGFISAGMTTRFGPREWVAPDHEFSERMGLASGSLRFELFHARGETDDHLWAWLPAKKAVIVGDFLIWVFPNAGNPQKVQRYPLDWAAALRAMAALEPELLLPAHGLPIAGRKRIAQVLDDCATALEVVSRQTLEMMNAGMRLNDIVHSVKLPLALMEKPYLRPVYDEPEFVIRNLWRLYGGWYDGNPANLKPASDHALALEIAQLAGGAGQLVARAKALSDAGEFRLACHLAELAAQAAPDDRSIHGGRAEVYEARMKRELSLMARGIYGDAARQSRERAGKNS